MKEMAAIYGYDISRPAKDAKEAIQWLYFGYLAAIKTQNGAAMCVGRVSTFLDIYVQTVTWRKGITHRVPESQELVDHYDHETAYGEVRQNPVLQPAVLRGPGLGDTGGGRSRA